MLVEVGFVLACEVISIALLWLRFDRALRVLHARFRAAALGWPVTAKPFATLAAPPARPPAWAVGLANSCPQAGHFIPPPVPHRDHREQP